MGKKKGKSSKSNFNPLNESFATLLSENSEYEKLLCSEFVKNLQVAEQKDTTEKSSSAILPDHACSYCCISNPATVVKCNTCNRWFCNASSKGSASHIVTHLVRSRHKEISLHPESPLGDSILECYNCGCKNIFLLGFVPAKADSVVVLLCRQPCAMTSVKNDDWDTNEWHSIIEERSFLPWLVAKPSDDEIATAKHITVDQINRIEEAWREKPQADLDEIERMEQFVPDKVKIHYESTSEYSSIFNPLVALEAEYDRQLKLSQRQENVTIRWDVGLNMKRVAWFCLTTIGIDVKITAGDELRFIPEKQNLSEKDKKCFYGLVFRVPPSLTDEIAVEMEDFDVPTDFNTYTVEIVWKAVPYLRMFKAIKNLHQNMQCISPDLKQGLLSMNNSELENDLNSFSNYTVPIPRKISISTLTSDLNPSQVQAICEALQRPLSLIQGPPGTGKTVTSATLIYHMVKLNLGPVLVCAPSNVAVDQLAEKISQTGLRVIRVTARSREALETSVSHLSLHEQVKKSNIFPDLQKLSLLREKESQMSAKDESKYRVLMAQTEKILLQQADVICCTCIGAGDNRLISRRFKTVVIDEATQACEPECLIPFTLGAERAILIGDHQQLGPVIMCKKAARAGFSQSLFERLVLSGVKPFRLQVQYRMHPCLSEFPSNAFYEGTLQNGVSASERSNHSAILMQEFPWPKMGTPMFFHVNLGLEEVSASGTSYLNRTEAMSCEKFVTKLLKSNVLPSSIGIITPYEGQRAYLINYMQQNGTLDKSLYSAIEVASVDAFQGREKDYIILSCVRSNDHMGIGFLSDYRRLNVALTRAKYGLIILGNAKVLSRHPLWYHLLLHFKTKGLMVEGPISNLRLSLLILSQPQRSRSFKRISVNAESEDQSNVDYQCVSSLGEINDKSLHYDQFSLLDFLSQTSIQETVLFKAPETSTRTYSPLGHNSFFSFNAIERMAQNGNSFYSQSTDYFS